MMSADDFRLLAEIRDVYDELDPLPPEVLTAARGALAWLTVDAELAELTLDSVTESSVVRSRNAPRLITFEAPSLAVEVEIAGVGETRRLVGQLVPPGPARLTLRSAAGDHSIDADELGRFTADNVASGPVSLLCRRSDSPDRPIVTSWIVI